MLWRIFSRRIVDLNGLFNGHFMDAKALYAITFDQVACISFIGEIDTSRAFELVRVEHKMDIRKVYQHAFYDHTESKMFFNNTIFLLNSRRMIELGNNYCHVLHTPEQYNWANDLIMRLAEFRVVTDERVIGFARQTTMN